MTLRPMLHKHPKTGIFYFRKRIPKELVDSIGRKEFKKSLQTKDLKTANERVVEAEVKFNKLLNDERNRATIPKSARNNILKYLRENALIASNTTDVDLPLLKATLRREAQSYRDISIRLNKDVKGTIEMNYRGEVQHVPALIAHEYQEDVVKTLQSYIAKFEGAPAKNWFIVHDVDAIVAMESPVSIELPKAPPISSPTLSDMFERWQRERNPSGDSLNEWKNALRRFTELVGNLPVDQITKAHVREFKDAMQQIPSRIRMSVRKKTLPELLKDVKAGKLDGNPLSPATINKLLAAISSLLSVAVENGYVDINVANNIRLKENNHNEPKRLPYDKDDLEILFNSPIYRGCKSARNRTIQGDEIIRDDRFWIPLLALYTGARLEEIGQSLVNDVMEENGIYYLDLNTIGEGKTLKTASSRRKIPLHKNLIDFGFIKYVDGLRKSGEIQLFPQLIRYGNGKMTKGFSRKYNDYARQIGITDRRKVFHSFRHSFKDACRNAGIEEAIHDALTGHSSSHVGRGYGSGYNLETLNKAIQKITYQLNLKHLR